VKRHQLRIRVFLRPRDARTCSNRAGAYRRQGRIDQAIADYREVLKLDPALAQARSRLQGLGVREA
jgi:Flp pilus assembly protein TadD